MIAYIQEQQKQLLIDIAIGETIAVITLQACWWEYPLVILDFLPQKWLKAPIKLTNGIKRLNRIGDGLRNVDDLVKQSSEKSQILFGQRGVSPNFSTKGFFEGADINDIVAQLKSGKISPDDLPIKYIEFEGQKVAINNRSLATLSKAGAKPTNTINVTGKLSVDPNDPDNLFRVNQRLIEMNLKPSKTVPIRKTDDWNSPAREIIKIVE